MLGSPATEAQNISINLQSQLRQHLFRFLILQTSSACFTSSALQTQELAATINLHFILLCRDEVETPLVIDLQTVQFKKSARDWEEHSRKGLTLSNPYSISYSRFDIL